MSLSGEVIGCAMEVHRTLGPGFLEAVYEEAFAIEMNSRRISFLRQAPLKVHYKQRPVGKYIADFIVEDELVIELKAIKGITPLCEAQLLHYLAISKLNLGLLLNFGAISLQVRRRVINFPD